MTIYSTEITHKTHVCELHYDCCPSYSGGAASAAPAICNIDTPVFGGLLAHSENMVTNTHTHIHTTSTLTLAAHACRGLINYAEFFHTR